MTSETTTASTAPSTAAKLKPEDWPQDGPSGPVLESAGRFSSDTKNQIYFVADNQTPFNLNPRSDTYAYWGDFDAGPTTVSPYKSEKAGHLTSSSSPFVGSLGIVGYSIKSGKSTVYAVLLGSNPYISVRSNWAYVQLTSNMPSIGKDTLEALCSAETQSDTIWLDGKTLKVVASIGQADNSTATFLWTWQ